MTLADLHVQHGVKVRRNGDHEAKVLSTVYAPHTNRTGQVVCCVVLHQLCCIRDEDGGQRRRCATVYTIIERKKGRRCFLGLVEC